MARVTNKLQSRRERKKEAIRSQIIASGIELFSARGIEDVTVEEIAEAADIGKGTIYNYFQTKEDIVVAFIVETEGNVQAELRSFASSKRRLHSILTDFIRSQFRMKEPQHRFIRVFLAQMFFRTEQFLPYMVEIDKVVTPPLEALFRDLQARRIMRADLNLQQFLLS